jgi:hypothetical protein
VGLSLEYRQLRNEGRVAQPLRMVHTDRYLFVGDCWSHSILVYSLERDWAFVRAIGLDREDTAEYDWPTGMCVYRDRLIVCDHGNCRLQFIDMSAADSKDWRLDAPFGSEGAGKGQFRWPSDVCAAGGVLFVVDNKADRVQSFTIDVDTATGALPLTHRSFIGGFTSPTHSPAHRTMFRACLWGNMKQISCIDVESGAVRPFVNITYARAICLADGLLYAVHGRGCLSIIHAESGAIQRSAVKKLHGRSWGGAAGIVVLPDFICIADPNSNCVHVIVRTS